MEMNGNSREAVFQEIISLADAMADRLTARRRDFHKYADWRSGVQERFPHGSSF